MDDWHKYMTAQDIIGTKQVIREWVVKNWSNANKVQTIDMKRIN